VRIIGVIDLKDGVFKITGMGLTQPNNGLAMRGIKAKLMHPLTLTMGVTSSTINSAGHGVQVKGLHLEGIEFNGGDGQNASNYAGWAVGAGGFADAVIDRCKFTGYWGAALRGADIIDALRCNLTEFTNINTSLTPFNSSGSAVGGRYNNTVFQGCWWHDTGTPTTTNGKAWCLYLNSNVRSVSIVGCKFERILGAGISSESYGDPFDVSYNLAINGCTFDNFVNGLQAIQANTIDGLDISGNTFKLYNGAGSVSVYDVQSWAICNNTFVNDLATTIDTLGGIGVNMANYNGLIAGNIFHYAHNIMNGFAMAVIGCRELDIVNNRTTGYPVGVHLWNASNNPITGVNVVGNKFAAEANAVRNFPHGSTSRNVTCGVLINGACDQVRVRRNRVVNMDADVVFVNESGGTGTPGYVLFEAEDPRRTLGQCIRQVDGPPPTTLEVVSQILSSGATLQPTFNVTTGTPVNTPVPTQGVPVADADLKVTFNNNAPRLSFVQGEDRTVGLVIQDRTTGEPVDLTGASLQVCLPRLGGGTVRRVAGTEVVDTALIQGNVFTLTSHGLVTGDTVTAAVQGGGALPAGLLAATPYQVRVIDNNTFALQSGGADLTLTSTGSGKFTITNATDLTVDAAVLGHAVLTLSAAVTAAVRDSLAQDLQINVITSTGKKRIAVLKDVLDVWAQTEP